MVKVFMVFFVEVDCVSEGDCRFFLPSNELHVRTKVVGVRWIGVGPRAMMDDVLSCFWLTEMVLGDCDGIRRRNRSGSGFFPSGTAVATAWGVPWSACLRFSNNPKGLRFWLGLCGFDSDLVSLWYKNQARRRLIDRNTKKSLQLSFTFIFGTIHDLLLTFCRKSNIWRKLPFWWNIFWEPTCCGKEVQINSTGDIIMSHKWSMTLNNL